MLIKLRFIGLLLILLLSTSIFGQNYQSMSLHELKEELNYWNNCVNQGDWWFFRRMRGSIDQAPAFQPNIKGLKIWMKEKYGKDYFYVNSNYEPDIRFESIAYDQKRDLYDVKGEVTREIGAMQKFSNNQKAWHRNNTIPAIENAIRNHPDNPNKPGPEPSGATHCHSIGSGSYMIGNTQSGNKCYYHSNGRLRQEVPYAHGKRHGTLINYFDNGDKQSVIPYWNGEKNGKFISWWRNRNIKSTLDYEDGKQRGEYRTWYENGRPSACWTYHYDGSRSKCPL